MFLSTKCEPNQKAFDQYVLHYSSTGVESNITSVVVQDGAGKICSGMSFSFSYGDNPASLTTYAENNIVKVGRERTIVINSHNLVDQSETVRCARSASLALIFSIRKVTSDGKEQVLWQRDNCFLKP